VTLDDLDLNERRQHRFYCRGLAITREFGLDDQHAAAVMLGRALDGNDKLDACHWLGRLHGLVTPENGYPSPETSPPE